MVTRCGKGSKPGKTSEEQRMIACQKLSNGGVNIDVVTRYGKRSKPEKRSEEQRMRACQKLSNGSVY